MKECERGRGIESERNGATGQAKLSALILAAPCGVISQWQAEPKERLISLVLTHLPLLKPGNAEAKGEYMRLLPKILTHTIEFGRHLEESRQLLSYALIHPATSLEDRAELALWLNHLEERAASRAAGDSLERVSSTSHHGSQTQHLYPQHQRYGSDDRLNGWQGSRDSGLGWQTQQGCENGHLLLYPSSSVPSTINTVGTGSGTNSILPGGQHSPLKRSVSLTPPMSGPSNTPLGHGWLSQEDLRGRAAPDHAPLSPQSSVASSGSGGSEHMEDGSGLGAALRSTFHEEGSGMRGEEIMPRGSSQYPSVGAGGGIHTHAPLLARGSCCYTGLVFRLDWGRD
ncbi:hypothetical protein NFI96_004265 [Prochilodus magdalenae]|nr:hypothetical protein NFI96_004265 [Prochilodus magdalenae]